MEFSQKELRSEVINLVRDFGLRLDGGIKQIDGKVKATFQQAHSVYSKMGTDVKERFAIVNERFSKLEAFKPSSSGMEFQSWFENDPPREAVNHDLYSSKINNLEAKLSRLEGRLDSNLPLEVSRFCLEEYDAVKKLGQVESQLRDLSNKVSGQQTFSFGGMTFNNLIDMVKFVEKYGIKDCGVYPDSFAILFLSRPTPGSGQEDAARVVSAKKAGRTARESNLLATLKFDRPPPLLRNIHRSWVCQVGGQKQGFWGNLPNYKEFDELATSMKSTTVKDLDDWLVSMTSDVDSHDPAQRLMEIICTMGSWTVHKASGHHGHFLLLVPYYMPLLAAKDAWLLVRRSTAIIFIHLKSIRSRTMNLDDAQSPHAKATVMWTMMQSLIALKQILDTGVQRHPVVTKEILEFQLEHCVDASQLKAVEDLVDAVKAQGQRVRCLFCQS